MGFHECELAVQRRAGVSTEAARLVGMLDPGELSGGASQFLTRQNLAVLTARDLTGRLWTSPLLAQPGFLDGSSGERLRIAAAPRPGDPLARMPVGQHVGLIAIDFDTRRRFRVNGRLSEADGRSLAIEIEEAFGNCPKYIHRRTVDPSGAPWVSSRIPEAAEQAQSRCGSLDEEALAVVAAADTFFLGTTHPQRGVDSSHRGGETGFVRVRGGELRWPDYAGNNMFTSFGNLALDPTAALLFLDFDSGATLHLSGRAELEWVSASDDDGGTGRHVRFTPERFLHLHPPMSTPVHT